MEAIVEVTCFRASVDWQYIVLLDILEALLPPSGFLNPSLGAGPNSPWTCDLRTKKALCLVSKTWRQAVLPLLYREVSLRRFGQLRPFLDTLRTTDFGPLVRSISFGFYVPPGLDDDVVADTPILFRTCPNLRTLSLMSAFIRPPLVNRIFDLNPDAEDMVSAIREVAPSIVDLRICDYDDTAPDAPNIASTPLLLAFRNLVRLTLSTEKASHGTFSQQTTVSAPPLEFPKLKRFSVWYHRSAPDHYFQYLAEWKLPLLKEFYMRPLDQMSHRPNADRNYLKFFEMHGSNLELLDLGPRLRPTLPLDAILLHCPKLRHLVSPQDILDTHDKSSLVPLPPRVDAWETRDYAFKGPYSLSHRQRARLDEYRVFDHGLSHLPDLPHLLPLSPRISPRCTSETVHERHFPFLGPVEVHQIFGVCIVEVGWLVFRLDAVDLSDSVRQVWSDNPQILRAQDVAYADISKLENFASNFSSHDVPGDLEGSDIEGDEDERENSNTDEPEEDDEGIEGLDEGSEDHSSIEDDDSDKNDGDYDFDDDDTTSDSSEGSSFWQIDEEEVGSLGFRSNTEGYIIGSGTLSSTTT